jgi:hypothetical protein
MTSDTCDRVVATRSPLADSFGALEPETDVLDATRGAIETRRLKNRRDVRFSNFDEFLADADRLASGPVRQLGNWTLAQIFDHLARSMSVSVDGTNEQFPWPLRIALRLVRKRIIGSPDTASPRTSRSFCDPNHTRGCASRCGDCGARQFDFRIRQRFRRIPHLAC